MYIILSCLYVVAGSLDVLIVIFVTVIYFPKREYINFLTMLKLCYDTNKTYLTVLWICTVFT